MINHFDTSDERAATAALRRAEEVRAAPLRIQHKEL